MARAYPLARRWVMPSGLASVELVSGLDDRSLQSRIAGPVATAAARAGPDVVCVHNVFDPAVIAALDALQPRPLLPPNHP